MAGGKESPRQKMIGMMYLVLTALLALNVSNAVLEKFAILNTTLQELKAEENVANIQRNQAIQDASSKSPKVADAKKKGFSEAQWNKGVKALGGVIKQEMERRGIGQLGN